MWSIYIPGHGWHRTNCLVTRHKIIDEWDPFPWCTCDWWNRQPSLQSAEKNRT